MHSAGTSSTGICNSIAILAIFLAQKCCFLDILKKNADSKKERGNYMTVYLKLKLSVSKRVNLMTLNKLKLLHCCSYFIFTFYFTYNFNITWHSCREAHFLISLMKILREVLKTRSAYAYCHKFTKKCNAKYIILIDVLVEMEMIPNISRISLSFF